MGEAALALPEEAHALQERLRLHTLPFLAGLLGCTAQEAWQRPLAFQVFDDVEGRRDARLARLARALFGSLAFLAPEFEQRNRAGAGIFLAVNGTDGVGRSKANIQELRAWWADLDEKAATAGFRPEDLPLAPSLQVRSGHGHHLYWRAWEPYACMGNRERVLAHEAELRRIQADLAAFGADPAVCEVARVMRLPGFWNRKREPHRLVELVSSQPLRYTQEEIRAAFPEASRLKEPSRPVAVVPLDLDEKTRRAHAYARALADRTPAIAGAGGHRTTLQAAIKVTCGFDLGEEEAFQVLWDAYNPACRPPWSEAELRRKVQEAQRVHPNRGWLLDPGGPRLVTRGEGTKGPTKPAAEPIEGLDPARGTPVLGEDPTRPCFPPFRLDTDGLWYLQKGKSDDDGTEASVRLCLPAFRAVQAPERPCLIAASKAAPICSTAARSRDTEHLPPPGQTITE